MTASLAHTAWVLGLVLLLSSTPAAASPRIAIEACGAELAAELQRLLAVELAALPQLDSGAIARSLRIRCDAKQAEMTVIDLGRTPVRRRVDLGEVDDRARARVLAISAAELLRAVPVPLPSPPKPGANPKPAPRQSESGSFAIGLGPSLLTFPTGAGPFFGGTLLSRVELSARAALEASASVAAAEQQLTLGRAELLLGHAFAGASWRVVRRGPESSVFMGLRGGWIRGGGHADDPDLTMSRAVTLPWGGPVLGADLRWQPSLVGAGLRAEAGYALLSAYGRVDRAREVELHGAFLSLTAFVTLGT